jgi:hypothetical protein
LSAPPAARDPCGTRGGGATRCVTPRQTCPRPNGFGRNLRSKTRWFTGFCNSHQVSHFATFFIDARAEISVAESRLCFERGEVPRAHRERGNGGHALLFVVPWRGSRRGSVFGRGAGEPPDHGSADGGLTRPRRRPGVRTCSRVVLLCRFRQ